MTNSEDDDPDSGSWNSILGSLFLGSILSVVCLILFDLIRKPLWWIYEPRSRHPGYSDRTPEAPPAQWLGWLFALVKNYRELHDQDMFEKYGIDAVMLLILTRFCIKSCTFACILGLACLLPIYMTANNHDIVGFKSSTLATCLQDPESNAGRLWIAVGAAWLMTAHTLFSLGEIYEQFIQLRHRYFVKRALDCERLEMDMTPGLTLMLENLPAHLRESDEGLKDYFEKLFPGQIFCVRTMKQKTQKMEAIVEAYETLEQFEADLPGEDTLQCKWQCGQPLRCLCCLCGQPGVCTCAADYFPGLYDDALPNLEAGKSELMEKMITVHRRYTIQTKGDPTPNPISLWWCSLCGEEDDLHEPLLDTAQGEFGVTKIEKDTGEVLAVYKTSLEAAESCGGCAYESDIIQCCKGSMPVVQGYRWRWAFMDELETMYHQTLREVAMKPWEKACKRENQGRQPAVRGEGVTRRKQNNRASAFQNRVKEVAKDIESLENEEMCIVSVYKWVSYVSWRIIQIVPQFISEFISVFHSFLGILLLAMNCKSDGSSISGTAFVTFKRPTTLATALRIRLDRHPVMMKATEAPEKRDIYWNNIAVPQAQVESRVYVANVLLLAGVVFWSGIVALCSTLPRQLRTWFNYDSSGEGFGATIVREYLPVLALLALLNLLPLLFKILAIAFERRKLQSEVDISVVRRFVFYQFANVYVALMAGSMAAGLKEMVIRPLSIFEAFSESVASQAAFFFNFLVFKMCMSPLWLLRTWPLVSRGWVPPRAEVPPEVPSVPYGWAYPKQIVVMLIVYTYWVICPLMLPVALVTCVAHDMFFRYLIIYGHMPHYESGGQFWYLTFDHLCASLCIGSFLMAIVMGYKASIAHFLVLLPLPFAVLKFNQMAYNKYYLPSKERALSEIVEDDKFLDVFKERWNVKVEDRLNADLYVQPSFKVYNDVLGQGMVDSDSDDESAKDKKKRRGRSVSLRPVLEFGAHHIFGWIHTLFDRQEPQEHIGGSESNDDQKSRSISPHNAEMKSMSSASTDPMTTTTTQPLSPALSFARMQEEETKSI